MRDIIVYKCGTCDRELQLARKPKTIETIGKCIITTNCRGNLYVERVIKTTSPFIKRTEEVVGLDDYYQRAKLFKFTQKFEKTKWSITHNLETFPIVSVYDTNGDVIPDSDFVVTVVNKNKIEITFDGVTSGSAELYVREVSPTAVASYASTDELETTPVSSNLTTGTMAILTKLPRDEASDSVQLALTTPTGVVQYNELSLTSVNANSPWSGIKKIIIKGKTYYVGFVDFFEGGFSSSLITSGTTITVESSDRGVSHFLLAESPYERADILKNKILDVGQITSANSSLFFQNDEIICNNVYITTLLPNLIIS